jgi:hypothetical protein
MQGDMIRFIAFDFILRIIRRGVVDISLVPQVFPMNFLDYSGDTPRL